MRLNHSAASAGLLFIAALAVGSARADPPKVVVSVMPIHSLVAAVMQGVAEPTLLIRGGSPHNQALRPSDAQALQAAGVIVWIGPDLETFLSKSVEGLAGRRRLFTVGDLPGIARLRPRRGGAWPTHWHAEHDHREKPGHAGNRGFDPHLWLDPVNAGRIVEALAMALQRGDPANAGRYAANAEALKRRIRALESEMSAMLAPVRDTPYVVFHDAYQYLEHRFQLSAVGALTVNPERPPGARRLSEIRDKIVSAKARCVFREPQFPPALIRTVVEGTGAEIGVLDPVGAEIPAGPEAYFTLMRNLAKSLRACLSR